MAGREPSRFQYLTRLSYENHTPAFLVKLQNRVAGVEEGDDGDGDEEYEDDGSGRPPIPKRPSIPQRPREEPGSADEEEEGDERPQVVVLKEGKHLTEREAENERRKQKGLPPLPESTAPAPEPAVAESPPAKDSSSKARHQTTSLQFSSSKSGFKPSTGKRKAVGEPESSPKQSTKKAKKPSKKLLSFGDDA